MCQIVVTKEQDDTYSVCIGKKILGLITPWYFLDKKFWRITGYSDINLFKTIAEAVDWLVDYWEKNLKD